MTARQHSSGKWAGANSNAAVVNVAGSQEVVTSTSGGLGEAETAGVVFNVISRDGGNTYSGSFVASGASGSMQGSNYTQALKDAGLKSPSQLLKVYEVNPMGGGKIVKDRLWFYLTYRAYRDKRPIADGRATLSGLAVSAGLSISAVQSYGTSCFTF